MGFRLIAPRLQRGALERRGQGLAEHVAHARRDVHGVGGAGDEHALDRDLAAAVLVAPVVPEVDGEALGPGADGDLAGLRLGDGVLQGQADRLEAAGAVLVSLVGVAGEELDDTTGERSIVELLTEFAPEVKVAPVEP